jgi:hypothetical protein
MFLQIPFLTYGVKLVVSPMLNEFQFKTLILNIFPLIDEGFTTYVTADVDVKSAVWIILL